MRQKVVDQTGSLHSSLPYPFPLHPHILFPFRESFPGHKIDSLHFPSGCFSKFIKSVLAPTIATVRKVSILLCQPLLDFKSPLQLLS